MPVMGGVPKEAVRVEVSGIPPGRDYGSGWPGGKALASGTLGAVNNLYE